ncbi:MAG TPA: hypothetical protein VLZ28_00705, partial [Daejeonella sp.]|nr:hypothetical protein [Daejeonella sp.]
MIYPHNAPEKLGFAEIKELIKGHCVSPMGEQMVDKIQLLTNFDHIHKFLSQTKEFKNILLNDSPLPINNFFDIKSLAAKLKIEGTYLSEEEFFQVYLSLNTVFAVIHYFSQREGIYPNLEALFEHLPIEKSIIQKIEVVIDPKGKIKTNASKELFD